MSDTKEPIDQAIRQLLIERDWEIDETVTENSSGELREFIHPETRERMAWLDAVQAQGAVEDCQKLTSSTGEGYSCAEENNMADTKAIKKLKSLLEDKDKDGKTKESVSSLAIKLGIARGTLLGIVSGTSQPRLDVMLAAKKIGIRQEDWS